MRWRAFCDEVLDAVHGLGITTVLTLGALLSDSPHTRPTPVTDASDSESAARFGLESGYQGPRASWHLGGCWYGWAPAMSSGQPCRIRLQPPSRKAKVALLCTPRRGLDLAVDLRLPTRPRNAEARRRDGGEDEEVTVTVTSKNASDEGELRRPASIARGSSDGVRQRDDGAGRGPVTNRPGGLGSQRQRPGPPAHQHQGAEDDRSRWRRPPATTTLKGCNAQRGLGVATDTGLHRDHNEDALGRARRAAMFVVADGMGGHQAGEVASAIAVAVLDRTAVRDEFTAEDVASADLEAHDEIAATAAAEIGRAGMGTTVTGLAVVTAGGSQHWAVFNVGDSRVYRWPGWAHDGSPGDHGERHPLDSGRLDREQARSDRRRNIITRSLGSDDRPLVDMWVFPPEPGEQILDCSDGLSANCSTSRSPN